jgi:hypothetical protein
MKLPRCFTSKTVALAFAAVATFFFVTRHETKTTALASEEAVHEVYVVFEGPWAFAADPMDANSVIALAPKTKSHRDLTVQTWNNKLTSGVYELSLPARTGPASGTIDPNILQARIDPVSVQHVLDSKSERYAIRLPKPDAYVAATHYRSRAGSAYPPDASTEKDYVTSLSLRYSVGTLNGFSLAGSPDSGTFNPLLLRVDTPTINFVIEPVHDRDPNDPCHLHAREAFRDLTKLVNVNLFLDFPNDPSACQAMDPQNPGRVRADIAPGFPSFFVRGFAGGLKQHLLAAIYFFGTIRNCEGPNIVGGSA